MGVFHVFLNCTNSTKSCNASHIISTSIFREVILKQEMEKMSKTRNESEASGVFCKNGVLRNFANFTGKQLCWSLFGINPQACSFLKKRPCFSREICKIFEKTFFKEHFWWLLLYKVCSKMPITETVLCLSQQGFAQPTVFGKENARSEL